MIVDERLAKKISTFSQHARNTNYRNMLAKLSQSLAASYFVFDLFLYEQISHTQSSSIITSLLLLVLLPLELVLPPLLELLVLPLVLLLLLALLAVLAVLLVR